MRRNYLLYIVIISIITLFCISSAKAVTSNLCTPNINLVSQDPIPANPNSYVKVVFEVSDLGNCQGLAVRLNPEYPFSLDPGYNSIQTIQANPYSPGYQSIWTIPYTIRIAEDALEGEYSLKLQYSRGSGTNFDNYIEEGFNISIIDTQTDFDAIIQEASGSQVSLGIVNIGKNTANSVIVKIPQQENFRASGTSEQIVGNLAAGDYTIVSFNIAALMNNRNMTRAGYLNSTQNPGEQTLKVEIDYTDGIGKRRSATKDVQFSGSLSQENSTIIANFRRTNSSSGNLWLYIVIIVIVIVLAIIGYKNRAKIKKLYKKIRNKEGSKNIPKWVLSEITAKKK